MGDQNDFHLTVLGQREHVCAVTLCYCCLILIQVGLVMFAINHVDPYEWSGRHSIGRASEIHAESFNLSGSLWFAFTTLQWQGNVWGLNIVSLESWLQCLHESPVEEFENWMDFCRPVSFWQFRTRIICRSSIKRFLLSGYERAPRSVAGRVLSIFWFTFVTITLITYTASLVNWLFWASTVHGKDYVTQPIAVSFLSLYFYPIVQLCFLHGIDNQSVSEIIQDLEHLVMSNQYTYGCVGGGSTYNYLTQVRNVRILHTAAWTRFIRQIMLFFLCCVRLAVERFLTKSGNTWIQRKELLLTVQQL